MPDFLLPDLGEGLEEADIVAWHVAEGDVVAVDQIVVEVETAKAAVEVPVPFAGTVTKLHAQPGEVVRVGAPLLSVTPVAAGFREPGVVVADASEASQAASSAASSAVSPAASGSSSSAPSAEGSGNVLIGYGTQEGARRTRRPRRLREPASTRRDTGVVASVALVEPGRPAVISPLVRRLAREAGLDVADLAATHPSGVIRRRDVEAALEQTGQLLSVDADVTDLATGEGARRIPLRGVRRAIADKLSTSRREIPEATVWVDVDATELLAARAQMNAATPNEPVSLLALLARFTVAAVQRYPELNARIDGDEIVVPDHVNLGFAAQTERGLVVPVVHGAHRLTTRALSSALRGLTERARSGTLAPSDVTGGTITVNNYGVFGVDGSAAIINHPEVAIIGMGRVIDRPWVVDGELTVRKVSQLTLAFDHRVCDGGTAGGFLRLLADCVEHPARALADL